MLFALFLALGLIAGHNANPASGCSGCNIEGTCVPVGQTHTKDCAVYNCTAAGSYNLDSYGCKVGDECKSNGDTWQSSQCVTKSCTVTQNPWSAVIGIAYIGCAVGSGCKNNSETWNESACVKNKCVVTTNPYSAKVDHDFVGCTSSQGCQANGQSWTENCITRTCEVSETSIASRITGAQCKDVNGACHEEGAVFAYLTYSTCNCTINPDTFARSYACFIQN